MQYCQVKFNKNKKNFLECPNSDIVGHGNILCDKTENSNNNEQCPEGYECLKSLTNFNKHLGQTSNHICCKRK